MTAHEQYQDDLPLYAVGALSGERNPKVWSVIWPNVPLCQEELNSLNEAAAQIALAVEPATPPALFRERLMARLEEHLSAMVVPQVRGTRSSQLRHRMRYTFTEKTDSVCPVTC